MVVKRLRLDWVIMEGEAVPDAVRDKNVVLVSRPDATHTGPLLAELLAAHEIETLASASEPLVLPWSEDRYVILAVGKDRVSMRDAAETAVRNLISAGPQTVGAPVADVWMRTAYEAPPDDRVYETVERLTFAWDDEELPLADLAIDVEAKPRRRVSAAQAAEDVERLFYLFSHGYGGYGFLTLAAICLVWGGVNVWRTSRAPRQNPV